MKIGIVGDVHFCQYSSILRKRGEKYSQRLENLVKSINYVEEQFTREGCEYIVYLGDFFDRKDINDEEATALREIKWANARNHFFLVGNHESSVASLKQSSTKVLETDYNILMDEPSKLYIDESTSLYFIPYITQDRRKTLKEYIDELDKDNPISTNKIVFSHNDIMGLQYGRYTSQEGFELDDIKSSCNMFLNGHLHNEMTINEEPLIKNLGNLSGQDFKEDANKYRHNVYILDTDSRKLVEILNKFAYNFRKILVEKKEDFSRIPFELDNQVLNISCEESLVNDLKNYINTIPNISDYKITTFSTKTIDEDEQTQLSLSINHLEQFVKFVEDNLGTSAIIEEELGKVVA